MMLFVATGINSGASTTLQEGCHTVGSALARDVIISDADIPAHAFSITLDDDGPKVAAVDGPIILQFANASHRLEPGDSRPFGTPAVVRVGTTNIALLSSIEEIDETPPEQSPAHGAFYRHRYLIGLGAVALITVAVLGSVDSANVEKDELSVAHVTDSVNQLGFDETFFVGRSDDGIIEVSGLVAREQDVDRLSDTLSPLPVRLQVVSGEMTDSLLRTLTDNRSARLNWALAEDETVRISGAVPDIRVKDEIRASVVQFLPKGLNVAFDVETFEEISRTANAKLKELGLSPQVYTSFDTEGLRLGGSMEGFERPKIDAFMGWLNDRYLDEISFESELQINPFQDPLASLQAVYFGSEPALVIEDGHRVQPGEIMPNGWTLEDIDSNRIKLRRGDEVHIVTF